MTDKPFQKQTASNSGRYDVNILARYNDYFTTRKDDRDRHAPVVDVQICEELNAALADEQGIAEQILAQYSTDEEGDVEEEEKMEEDEVLVFLMMNAIVVCF